MDVRVGENGRYILKKKIGAGSFGEIYVGIDSKTNEKVALKLESKSSKSQQLFYESKLYILFSDSVCIPKVHWYGVQGDYNVLVMDLLGHSLQDLFYLCNKVFSLKTVLMLADQMLCDIEFIHSKDFIHRDIKPENFLLGRGNRSNQIYMIDFGLSKTYIDRKTNKHIDMITGKSLTGTLRYASINALSGLEQSRRDDMESLAYVWIYFLKGALPWQNLKLDCGETKCELIRAQKQKVSVDELCEGIPVEFKEYIENVRILEFEQEPNYSEYRKKFRDLFLRMGYVYDYKFDWFDKIKEDDVYRVVGSDEQSSQQKATSSNQKTSSDGKDVNVVITSQKTKASPFMIARNNYEARKAKEESTIRKDT